MTKYKEIVRWLFGLRRFGSKPGLVNVRHLLNCIGNPQESFKSIHITGTNGKGTTTSMITSILRAAGYKVGMFTSPHLSSFTERIVVDGRRIHPRDVVRIVNEISSFINKMVETPGLRHPTFFEVITVIAFSFFAEKKVDFAVLEVGMGGKLDATNVIHSEVAVITNVSLEHTDILGNTILEIAEKKAGIIKKGGVLITATENDDVYKLFRDMCTNIGSRIFRVGEEIKYEKLGFDLEGQRFTLNGLSDIYNNLTIPFIGEHQLKNAATAVGAVEALKYHNIVISREAIATGLSETNWPGRFEIVQRNPLVVLDSAKDIEATRAIKLTLLKEFPNKKRIAVVSISSDKNIPEMLGQLVKAIDNFVITAHSVMGRAADPKLIAEQLDKNYKPYLIVLDVKKAVEAAIKLAGTDGLVIVVGSLFLVGEARQIWYKTGDPDPSHETGRDR